MVKALAEANTQRHGLKDRIAQLEEANVEKKRLLEMIVQLEEVVESLRSENLSLKFETEEVMKVGVEDFRSHFKFTPDYEILQAFFVNFGARQVLSEAKKLYPNLDLYTIGANYPALEEAKDGADHSPTEGAEDSADHSPAEGA
ncbi:hypothetical protein Adt_18464 [Abeliophyllum distichum]|uniref:Uncharacterized protein n=1 Tax=Abeliophyllum distichum TaxID=126358 RepID=A0ABD1TJG4_9LAMI